MDSKLAVIMGGSIAGLLSAKVLSPYYSKIILLDRDSLFGDEIPRKGTAQAAHAHIFLQRGLIGMEKLLPGFIDKLKEAGAVSTNATKDWQSFFPHGLLKRFDSDIHLLCQSRHLLETTLRQFIIDTTPNIEIREKSEITNVQLSFESNPTIHTSHNDETDTMTPDILVDCTGRNSKSPLHLKSAGFGVVPRKSISPYLGYATRIFKNVTLDDNFCSTLIMAKDPEFTRGGVVLPIENKQHIVTLFGFSKDYPPGEEQPYLDFAKSLRETSVYDAIKNAEPTSEIKQFVKKDSFFNDYSKLTSWPKGFLVMGDAITSFNPIYGQGITTTIMSAEIIESTLKNNNEIELKSLQKKICRNSILPWIIAKNEDLRWPGTDGAKANFALKLMHRFSDRVARAATINKDVDYTYVSVLHMTKLPTALLKPTILFKIIKYGGDNTKLARASNSDQETPNPL